MTEATTQQLAAIRIFSPLEQVELEQLQPSTTLRSYSKGEIVMAEGDPLPACLFALVTGTLQMSKIASTGKETILRVLSAGEIFAAPAIVGDGIAPATVTATTDCEILTLKREALLGIIQRSPEIALRILMVFNQRLQQLHETVHGLMSERAIVRLARLLLYSRMEQGIDDTSSGQFLRAQLPYYQIARSIGITYEECVRLFRSLKPVVTYHRGGTIQILDLEGLDAIAAGQVEDYD